MGGDGLKRRVFLARPLVGEAELNAVRKVFDTGFLTDGEVTREFENRIANDVGAKFCVASSSGTTAIELSLRAVGVAGREVVVPDLTYAATADAVISAGGIPILVDVDIPHGNVSADAIEAAIGPRTACILPVSLFGNPLETDVYEVCAKNGIPVVEDAANSLGAEVGGRRVGSLADASCFSFHPRKIATTGEGGAVTTDNSEIESSCRSFKTFGSADGHFLTHGTNYKLSNILAAIGLVQLDRLEYLIRVRREKASVYDELLSKVEHVVTPVERGGSRCTYQTYVIYFDRDGLRDKAMKALSGENVESQIGAHALHVHPAFSSLRRIGDLRRATDLYNRLLALPLHHELANEDQRRICDIILDTTNRN